MLIKVRYQYAPKGTKPNVKTVETFTGESKTESYVAAFLKKRHPNWDIIILSIE